MRVYSIILMVLGFLGGIAFVPSFYTSLYSGVATALGTFFLPFAFFSMGVVFLVLSFRRKRV